MSSVDNKRIAKNTLLLYARMLLLLCIALYTSRVVIDKLGLADFGLYNVVGGIITMLSFLSGAMAATSQRFLSFELGRNNAQRLRTTFNQAIIVHIAIGLILLILAETVGLWFVTNEMSIPEGRQTAAMWVYQTMVLQFMLTMCAVPYNAVIIAREKMNIYAYIGVFEALLKLAVALGIGFISSNRLIWYAIIILISTIITQGCYMLYSRVKFEECRFCFSIDRDILKSMVGFAGWSILGSVAWIAKSQGVNVVLNIFFGTIINAAFGVANQVNAAVARFVQNFSTAMNPQIVQSYSSGDYSGYNNLVERGSKLAFMLLFVLSFPVMACIDDLLSIWLVEVPPYANVFSRLILIVSLLESFTYPIGTAIQATGKIKWYQIIVGLTLFMNVPLAWIALRLGCQPPVVLIIAVGIAVIALIERLFIMKAVTPDFSGWKFVRNVFVPAAFVGVCALILYALIAWSVASCSITLWQRLPLFAVLGIIVVWLVGLNRSERAKIYSIVKRKIASIYG
jgi:hypothetical protein